MMRKRSPSITRLLALAILLASASLAWWNSATGAKSLTVDEFIRLDEQNREDAIVTVLAFYYENVKDEREKNKISECISTKNQTDSGNGKSYFVNTVLQEIESVRKLSARAPSIEEIVAVVVDRECRPSE